MKKRKDKVKKKLILGIIFICIGIISIITKNIMIKKETKYQKELLNIFYQNKEMIEEKTINKEIKKVDQYIAILKIPIINLEKGLFNIESPNNNINKNIQILKESEMPNIENSNLILASHNGNTISSHFNEIHKLKNNDKVIIIYKEIEYQYKVVNSYVVEKTGEIEIIRDINKNTLTLISCYVNNKQLIIICELEK